MNYTSQITVKRIEEEWFQDYKYPSMLLAFPYCTFKCGEKNCQNRELAKQPNYTLSIDYVCQIYLSNKITKAIVCAGLEPFDSFDELISLIASLRNTYGCDDDIVIYTGYTELDCFVKGYVKELSKYHNIIIKYGRYFPNQTPHWDEILGVKLASKNQYSKRYE